MAQEIKKPSWIPPLVALVAILLSLVIYFLDSLKYSPAIYFAYILTPFIPIFALAIARTSDTKARSNVFYDLLNQYSKLSYIYSNVKLNNTTETYDTANITTIPFGSMGGGGGYGNGDRNAEMGDRYELFLKSDSTTIYEFAITGVYE